LHNIFLELGDELFYPGGSREMKEVANSFAQLAAIIMILITLAVSTAAISQLAGY
jgi:hypothetical protein